MWRWADVKMSRCEDEKMGRCEDEQMWRWEDVKMSRCEDEHMWRWADVKMNRCEDEKIWRWADVKMSRCEDEQMWRWEDVKMRRCEDKKMWRWADVKMSRCEDEQMWWEGVKMSRCEDGKVWRWADVKMRGCEDERMWRWADVKMRGCEDEMWRWEDVLQTTTIGRTLRSDALGKYMKHYWINGETSWSAHSEDLIRRFDLFFGLRYTKRWSVAPRVLITFPARSSGVVNSHFVESLFKKMVVNCCFWAHILALNIEFYLTASRSWCSCFILIYHWFKPHVCWLTSLAIFGVYMIYKLCIRTCIFQFLGA